MARYKPDNESFGRFMLSQQARRPVAEVAAKIAADAAQNGRRGEGEGPHYTDQYKVNAESEPVNIEPGGPRVGAEVFNDNIQATRDEFGNKRNPKVRPLGKAGDKYHVPKGVRRG